jgi:hypothetical protein
LPDILVSKEALNYSLEFANSLFLALEDQGHWVREAANYQYSRPSLDHREGSAKPEAHGSSLWSSARPTLVFIGGVAIGLSIFEIAENAEVMHEGDKWIRPPKSRATGQLRQVAS